MPVRGWRPEIRKRLRVCPEQADRKQSLPKKCRYAGADDYLPKPFSTDELAARLRALVRRSSGEAFSFFRMGDLLVRPAERSVERGGQPISLTAREFALLELLVRHPGRVFTRTQLCERVWGYHFDPGTNLVDVYVQRLRRKVDDLFAVKLIHTVRGTGYKLSQES